MHRSALILSVCFLACEGICLAGSPGGGKGPLVGQVYSCGTYGMTPEEMADVGVTVVSSFSWAGGLEKTKAWIDECHKYGIKVLPYVSAEKAWENYDRCDRRKMGISSTAIPFYRPVR